MENKVPYLSIITPTFNRSELLKTAVESVLNQSYDDFEYIIVNDGSQHPLDKLVKSFHDERIVCIEKDKNEGPTAARNVGIKSARGRYISFLDDYDQFLPDMLQQVYETFEADTKLEFLWTGIARLVGTEVEISTKSLWN